MSLRTHHLSCGTMAPPTLRPMCCHVLLIETSAGLVLVDSGLSERELRDPSALLGRGFATLARPVRDPSHAAINQIRARGFKPTDVRHIVLTHMDLDHAGGLPDFPHATLHVHRLERDAAERRPSFLERERYRPHQWSHMPTTHVYEPAGELWHGFECVRTLHGLPPEILLISLHGHTRGHSGIAVDSDHGWLLHAGDAYFHRAEVHEPARRCPPALDAFQRLVQIDGRERIRNQDRLRALASDPAASVRVFSAHDSRELNAFSST